MLAPMNVFYVAVRFLWPSTQIAARRWFLTHLAAPGGTGVRAPAVECAGPGALAAKLLGNSASFAIMTVRAAATREAAISQSMSEHVLPVPQQRW